MALRFRQLGLTVTVGCSTKNDGMNARLNTFIWDDLILYDKIAWARVVKLV